METKAKCDLVAIDFQEGTITIEIPGFITAMHAGQVEVDFKDVIPANDCVQHEGAK